jgi:hypothetical protein
MAQRRALSEISGNRPAGYQLTVNDRAQIVGATKCDVRPCEISRTFNFTRQTISMTVQSYSIRRDNHTIPRAGQPKKATDRDVRMIEL